MAAFADKRLFLLARIALTAGATATLCATAVNANPTTLEWSAKQPAYSEPQALPATTPAPVNATPYPSPYGNVGDPFVRRLNWSTKAQTRPQAAPQPAPQPVLSYAPTTPPEPEPRRHSVIMPSPAPAPALPIDLPPPESVKPAPAPKATPPAPQAPVAHPAPVATATPPVTAPSEPRREGAYQIPQTSKYYRGPNPAQTTNDTPPPATPPASPQSSTEDKPFVPGEVITNARTQSPRVYSLHRQYGLTPDAISSVSDNAPQPQSAPAKP